MWFAPRPLRNGRAIYSCHGHICVRGYTATYKLATRWHEGAFGSRCRWEGSVRLIARVPVVALCVLGVVLRDDRLRGFHGRTASDEYRKKKLSSVCLAPSPRCLPSRYPPSPPLSYLSSLFSLPSLVPQAGAMASIITEPPRKVYVGSAYPPASLRLHRLPFLLPRLTSRPTTAARPRRISASPRRSRTPGQRRSRRRPLRSSIRFYATTASTSRPRSRAAGALLDTSKSISTSGHTDTKPAYCRYICDFTLLLW